MTQEEKQLLLKDLSARFPYGVKVELHGEVCTVLGYYNDFDFDDFVILTSNTPTGQQTNIANIKPYLRPMSSMTDKEKDELYTAMDWYGEIDESGNVYTKGQEKVYRETFYEYTDWLNKHHFDFRGLIPMGLALEAPEDMYKND